MLNLFRVLVATAVLSTSFAWAQTPPGPKPAVVSPAAISKPPGQVPVTSTAATPTPGRAPCPASAADGPKVDINSAGVDALDTLYGIGPSRANDIIAGRKAGLYDKPEELVSRNVLPQSVFDCLKARVALANVNVSSAAAMAEVLPGIGAARAKSVVDGRKAGVYKSLSDLAARTNLPQPTVDALSKIIAY